MPRDTLVAHPGKPNPIGAHIEGNGVNFSLYSHKATGVELLLFSKANAAQPSRRFVLDPVINKSTNYWHIFIEGIGAGQLYAYQVHGENDPEKGLRFDPSKVLLDPYARAIIDDQYNRDNAKKFGESNMETSMKCVVTDPSDYDWEDDEPLNHPLNDTIIYELHVRGFTMDASSKVKKNQRGTYAGVIEKIPYLKELGINCVEIMPVFQFDRQAAPEGKVNYWGYQPVGFFAPHRAYSSDRSLLGPLNEFRDMVKAFHKEGIGVILDVVFNHTAEDNEDGPTFLFKGIDNLTYYLLDSSDKRRYKNDTGTGNTINANHSVVRRMIIDSLKYWVQEMHVDGFRFDLASVLSRGEDGHPMENPPLLWSVDSDPELVHSKIIAEAWDAAGLYQVGCFVGDRWAVMNGHFRDVVRRFIRGEIGLAHELADVLTGSARLFQGERIDAQRSVNFVTAHDGFTMNDLVSYEQKHNEENGEEGRDGTNANYSRNYGVEGVTDDPVVETLRKQQIKNFFTILLLAQGPPLISMGDEMRRTVGGNNNPYTMDSPKNWLDWKLLAQNKEIFRFVQQLIKKRKRSYIFTDEHIWSHPGATDVIWHGVKTNSPDWGVHSRTVALEMFQEGKEERYYAIINAFDEVLEFDLPEVGEHYTWALSLDTANVSPEDIVETLEQEPYDRTIYRSKPHSVAVLRTIRK